MHAAFRSFAAVCLLWLAAAATLTGCASSSPSAGTAMPVAASAGKDRVTITSQAQTTAQVVAIDRAARRVTLRAAGDRLAEVHCSDAVRNFDQIRVGDLLRVSYRQELTATKLPVGTPDADPQAGLAAARASAGERPGAAVGAMASVRVTIVSIDPAQDVVVFALPSGELVAHRVATAEGRAFVKGLEVGSKVQLDHAAAVALSVEAASAR
jgi:hypothetical protein